MPAPSVPKAPQPTEIIETDETTVACDGGGGVLGHPRVFLTLVEGRVMCPYCSRLFVLKVAKAA
jgi:uncharacterized Zn-finger protein